jgi:hypothetical protein
MPDARSANSWPTPNPWLAAVEPSPIGETKRWVLGRTFPADRPLIDLSQAVPGYPPALELRRHLGEVLLDPACMATRRSSVCRPCARTTRRTFPPFMCHDHTR